MRSCNEITHHSAPERLGVRPKRKFALRTVRPRTRFRRDQLALSAVPGLIGKTANRVEGGQLPSECRSSQKARTPVRPETILLAFSAQLRHTMRDLQWPVNVDSDHIFVSGSKALSAGPARPAEIFPGTTIHIALRIQGLRTRVFRRIELEQPSTLGTECRGPRPRPIAELLRPRAEGLPRRCYLPVAQPSGRPRSHLLTAGRPSTHDKRRTGRTYIMPSSHLL